MESLAACGIACCSFRRTPARWSASCSACPGCASSRDCMSVIGSNMYLWTARVRRCHAFHGATDRGATAL